MNEYKREQKYWQKEYTKLSEKLTHHDDHLRTIDAWFSQLLDEVRILAADALPTPPQSATSASSGMTPSSTHFAEYIC
jgi:E3 ubiquitin-protein ligase BRE1